MTNFCKKELLTIYLNNGFERSEAEAEISFAIEIISSLTEKDLIMGNFPDNEQTVKIKNAIEQRVKTGAPIAQILGFAYFMGHKFEVNPYTLIPRPETELLVKKTIQIVKENKFKQVLDIGTGSGCIACMCAKNTEAQVLGVDISNEALKIALNNAMHLDLMNRALFRKSDIFSKIRLEEKFDVIVSNPPYIPLKEKPLLQREVRDFEPESALFTDDEAGLEFYKKITRSAKDFLNNRGYVLFEVGKGQSQKVKTLFEENNFSNIEILEDVSGIERVVLGQLND